MSKCAIKNLCSQYDHPSAFCFLQYIMIVNMHARTATLFPHTVEKSKICSYRFHSAPFVYIHVRPSKSVNAVIGMNGL